MCQRGSPVPGVLLLEEGDDHALDSGLAHQPGQKGHETGSHCGSFGLEAAVTAGQDSAHHQTGGGRGQADQLGADTAQQRPQAGQAVLGRPVGDEGSQRWAQAVQVGGPQLARVQHGRHLLTRKFQVGQD